MELTGLLGLEETLVLLFQGDDLIVDNHHLLLCPEEVVGIQFSTQVMGGGVEHLLLLNIAGNQDTSREHRIEIDYRTNVNSLQY